MDSQADGHNRYAVLSLAISPLPSVHPDPYDWSMLL